MKTSEFSPRWLSIVILAGLLIPGPAFGDFPCNVTLTVGPNCVSDGSVALVAPTNSPVFCLGNAVTVTASVMVTNSHNQTVTYYDHCDAVVTDGGGAPTYAVTWTATMGSWSTNGTGLTATFKPPIAGSGTVGFGLSYTNVSPCNGKGTSGASGGFTVAALQSLSVSGATQVGGSNNWAAVKTSGDYVILTAGMVPNDTNAATLLTWSGGQAVPGNLFQRRVPKDTSAKTVVTASCCSTSITANVWIFWSTVSILTGGSNPPPICPQFGSDPDGTEILGVRYYDSTHNSAAGKITIVGTLTPSGINTIITNGFATIQMKMKHTFKDGSVDAPNYFNTWQPDGPSLPWFTTYPDGDDKLYSIDNPNIVQDTATLSHERYINFYDYITWNGQTCSDTNNFWHWQGRWKADQTPQITFTDLGTGTVTLQTTPTY